MRPSRRSWRRARGSSCPERPHCHASRGCLGPSGPVCWELLIGGGERACVFIVLDAKSTTLEPNDVGGLDHNAGISLPNRNGVRNRHPQRSSGFRFLGHAVELCMHMRYLSRHSCQMPSFRCGEILSNGQPNGARESLQQRMKQRISLQQRRARLNPRVDCCQQRQLLTRNSHSRSSCVAAET